ncbi:P-loop containing nucleoside triphosphate hydrolase protein [Earliella scabrosa]|nr:P-loop containing nucleoside triphosphate hydrolase protein [Earliella scabrosa]
MASITTRMLFADTRYGKFAKELHDVVNRMRAKGGQTVVDLPRIVLIGNQSAGKSSLVTAVSGVAVPRDVGTSTRSPMEIRLTRSAASDSWSGQISIRYEYEASGSKRKDVKEVLFGPRIVKKEDMEPMLRRAQAAVLHPHLDVSQFVTMSDDELRRLAAPKTALFSKNVVCIDLSGPDLVDLSFVDLPGIIHYLENDPEGRYVRLVKDLVQSYLVGNSLILVTIAMNDDIENQAAALLAKQADPNGSRTIGVLTKADIVPSVEKEQRWLEVLEGNIHATKHGYFCTRLPSNKERLEGITDEDARAAEADFFNTASPWSTSSRRERCGTPALVTYLSELLTQLIRDSLPKIMGDVEQQLRECKKQIDALPRAISTEPCSFVNTILMDFCDDIKAHMRGSPLFAELVQSNKKTYAVFKDQIRQTAPPFVPFHPENLLSQECADFSKQYLPPAGPHRGQMMYLRDVKDRILQHVTRELPNNVPYAAKVSLIRDFQKTWEQSALACFDAVQRTIDAFLLAQIEQQFRQYGNLKAVVSPVVKEQTNAHAEKAVAAIRTLLSYEATFQDTQNVEDLAEKRSQCLSTYQGAYTCDPAQVFRELSIRSHPPPAAFGGTFPSHGPKSSQHAGAFGGQTATTATATATPKPYFPGKPTQTSGTSTPSPRAAPSSSAYSQPPPAPPSAAPPSSSPAGSTPTAAGSAADRAAHEQEALAALAKLGLHVKAEDLAKLVAPVHDEHQEVLELMAEVRAYFDISYKRIVDYVMFAVDQHFMYEFSATLHRVLYEKLGLGALNARERCRSYLVEDPSIVARREELVAKKERLEDVYKALVNFGL